MHLHFILACASYTNCCGYILALDEVDVTQALEHPFVAEKSANFDPAFWKCEGARAKIVVYYPRNEIKIL